MSDSISTSKDFTLNDLTEIAKSGKPIYRTPHLGNLSVYNLVLGLSGIPIVCFDRNMTCKDTNYWPEYIINEQSRKRIAQNSLQMLTPYAQALADSSDKPAYTHWQSQKALFGDGISLETQYWIEHADVVKTFFRTIRGAMPVRIFENGMHITNSHHAIDADTFLQTYQEYTASIVEPDTQAPKRMMVPANAVCIALQATIAYATTGHGTILEVSGPDMIKYTQQWEFRGQFRGIIDDLKKGNVLPDDFQLVVVPSTAYRFASHPEHAAQLDLIVSCLETMLTIRAEYDEKLNKQQKQELRQRLAEPKAEIRKHMHVLLKPFHETEPFFTQYDLLDRDDTSLYIPDTIAHMPYTRVEQMADILDSLKEHTR